MLARESPATAGTAGMSAGTPPSNLSDNVALSPTAMVSRSKAAVNVAAGAAEAALPSAHQANTNVAQAPARICGCGGGAHPDTTTTRLEEVFSLSSGRGGEGRGEEANFIECPSPRPSPHSFLAGRGRKFLVVVSR